MDTHTESGIEGVSIEDSEETLIKKVKILELRLKVIELETSITLQQLLLKYHIHAGSSVMVRNGVHGYEAIFQEAGTKKWRRYYHSYRTDSDLVSFLSNLFIREAEYFN